MVCIILRLRHEDSEASFATLPYFGKIHFLCSWFSFIFLWLIYFHFQPEAERKAVRSLETATEDEFSKEVAYFALNFPFEEVCACH